MYRPIGEGFPHIYIGHGTALVQEYNRTFLFCHLLILRAEFTRAQKNCIDRQEIYMYTPVPSLLPYITSLSLLKDVQTEI
jgi:hypothetical protein